jgi:hypothetical protein
LKSHHRCRTHVRAVWLSLASLFIGAAPDAVAASNEPALVAFARDISGNDVSVVRKVRRIVDNPPTQDEKVGFYSGAEAPAATRAWLATVQLLNDKGYIIAMEDKYSDEMISFWEQNGFIDISALPPATRHIASIIHENDLDADELDQDNEQQAQFRRFLWENYAQATEDLEAQIRKRGKVLLSVDTTSGETMFYALVAPEVAHRWQGVMLSPADNRWDQGGVGTFEWDRYWGHLSYALGPLFIEEKAEMDYPPGTRIRP